MSASVLLLSDPAAERAVIACLAGGGIAAIPTETVYGLAVDASNGRAVARVFEAKERPSFNPLICHVADLAMAERIAAFDEVALRLAAAFWPGPLTLVLPLAPGAPVHPLVTAGLATVAVRMPRGPALRLIAGLGRPLAAPSANRSGGVSPTTAAHVLRSLGGRIDMILDGGPCAVGLESTIVRPAGGALVLLRPGGIPSADLARAAGLPVLQAGAGDPVEAPGALASHYAPAGRVRLDVRHVEPGEHWIAFGPHAVPGEDGAAATINLSPAGDLREAAANLFAALAAFDAPDVERIAVAPIPRTGLGEAINDRLTRAAAPRGGDASG